MIAEQVSRWDQAGNVVTTSETYVSERDQRVVVFDNAGNVVAHELWMPDRDELLAAEVIATYQGRQEYVLWPLVDHQGSVSAVYFQGQVEYVAYDAFGKPHLSSMDPNFPPNSPLFQLKTFRAGREYDMDLGLYYNRARWYDPASGRFISQDPIGFAGGDTNLYRYAFNSPDNATDPSGNAVNLVAGGIGAGIGAIVGGVTYAMMTDKFEWGEFAASVGAGAVIGGLAGLTFGASLAVTGTGAGGVAGSITASGTAAYVGKSVTTAAIATTAEAGIASWMEDDSFNWATAFGRNFAIDMAIGWVPGVAESKAGAKLAMAGASLGTRVGVSKAAGYAVSRYALHYGTEVTAGTLADTAWSVGIEGRGVGASFTQSLVGNAIGQGVGDVLSAGLGRVVSGAPGRLCFAAGTLVLMGAEVGGERHFQPIEKIRLGQRVAANDPLARTIRREVVEPDPESWRTVVLQPLDPQARDVQIRLLRSLDWLAAMGAVPGAVIQLEIPELNLADEARVQEITASPPIELGTGSVVTGTFQHVAAEIIEVGVEGLDEPIRSTPRHPYWSVTRRRFVPANELATGETLLGQDGQTARVIAVEAEQNAERVYNIEVQGEHVYHVSSIGLLVHNASFAAPRSGDSDVLVLGRGPLSRLERLATREGGHLSTTPRQSPCEIFKQNYRDIRKADRIVQYMDNIPETLEEAISKGGQYARAERIVIDLRKDILEKTFRKFETPPG